MKPQPTVMAMAFARAGFNGSEARLRLLALDALNKHHRNIGRALPTFEAAIDDDSDLIREALLHFLCRLDRELNDAGGHRANGSPENVAVSSLGGGAGHEKTANQISRARPVREPSAEDRAAAARVASRVALTILDTFRIRDGRAIGDVRYGELDRLRGLNAMEAAIIRQIQDHARAPHDARVRDVVKAVDLNKMIQKAAEIAGCLVKQKPPPAFLDVTAILPLPAKPSNL